MNLCYCAHCKKQWLQAKSDRTLEVGAMTVCPVCFEVTVYLGKNRWEMMTLGQFFKLPYRVQQWMVEVIRTLREKEEGSVAAKKEQPNE